MTLACYGASEIVGVIIIIITHTLAPQIQPATIGTVSLTVTLT